MKKAIERKLITYLGLVLLILIGLSLISYLNVNRLASSTGIVDHTLEVERQVGAVLGEVKNAETAQRGYLLTGEDSYLQPYHRANEAAWIRFHNLERLIADSPDQQQRAKRLEGLLQGRFAEMEETIKARRQEGFDAALRIVKTNEGRHLMEEVREQIGEMRNAETAVYNERLDDQASQSRITLIVVRLTTAAAVLLITFIGWVMHRELARYLQSERALRENEWQLKLALNAGNAGMWSWDPKTDRVLWSDEHYQLFGVPPCSNNISFDHWMNAVHADDRERVAQALRQAVKDRDDIRLEYRILLPEGDVRWMDSRGQVLCDAKNEVAQVTGIASDISNRKQAEATSRENEERFQQISDTIDGIFWMIDVESSRPIYISPAFERIYKIKAEEVLLDINVWLERIHPTDREWVRRHFAHNLTGEGFDREYRILTGDGDERWIRDRGYPIKDGAGQVYRVAGIAEDITERKLYEQERELLLKLEQQSREEAELSEQRFRILTETLPIIVWTATPEGHSDYFNQRWYDYCGLSYEQTFGLGFHQVLHPDDFAETVNRWERCLETGDEFEMEYRFRRAIDGSYRWHLGRALPLRDAHGQIIKWFGTCTDIDEQKKTEQVRAQLLELEREARDQAEANNRAKDEFIAVVSHELRSPLNAMLGWARVLRSDNLDIATQAHAVKVIEQSATMQSRLIEDLLDTARIISGKLRLEVQPLNLVSVIKTALEIVRPSYEAKELAVTLDLDATAGLITGDSERLQQVVWNLLSNAIKFTPRGGHIEVVLHRQDPYVTLSVKDNGKGISDDALPHIFDRFHQAGNTTTRRKGGLGLGLNLVRHLVEMHGGTIAAESPGEGQGATFTINLPVRAVAARVDEPKPRPLETGEVRLVGKAGGESRGLDYGNFDGSGETPSSLLTFQSVLKGLHILVVDDEEEARELVATLLRKYGATVTPTGSSREAIRTLTEAMTEARGEPRFDLLVSDIGMPEEDGYTMLQRIRKFTPEDGGAIPAIALTAYSRANDRIRALEVGFQMHVPKPVEPAELMMVIANLTGRSVR